MATPAATPGLGPQADGTNLWEVEVGGMDMETESTPTPLSHRDHNRRRRHHLVQLHADG